MSGKGKVNFKFPSGRPNHPFATFMGNTNKESIINLPIEQIFPNEDQPRKHFSEEAIEELATSIKEHGMIQPIVVRMIDRTKYQPSAVIMSINSLEL